MEPFLCRKDICGNSYTTKPHKICWDRVLWLLLFCRLCCIYNATVCACVFMFWWRCQVTCCRSLSRSFSSMAVMSSPTALSWTRRRFSSSKSAITYRHTHIQTSGQERWLIMTAPPNKQWAYIISYELMMFESHYFSYVYEYNYHSSKK